MYRSNPTKQTNSRAEANSTARPQTDVRFVRILSVWVGIWGRVRACPGMRWPCAQRAAASICPILSAYISLQVLNFFLSFIFDTWQYIITFWLINKAKKNKNHKNTFEKIPNFHNCSLELAEGLLDALIVDLWRRLDVAPSFLLQARSRRCFLTRSIVPCCFFARSIVPRL